MTADLVQKLIHEDPVPAMLGHERNWARVYGRTHKGGALLVYEPATGANEAMCVRFEGDTISSHPLWQDEALPALANLRATRPRARAVRYRPGKRCTLKLEGPTPVFLKCVADNRGAVINADARLLYNAGRAGYLGFLVARPAGWMPELRIIAQHVVPGAPVVPRLWHDPPLAARLGAANATLIAAPLQPSSRFTYADQMQRTAKYARRLEKQFPAHAKLIADLIRRLAVVTSGPANRPIHGAPHAHQWLDGPDGIGLVDFDRFSLGDPELDVATFVAEADFETDSGARTAAKAYSEAFEANWPVDQNLLNAYRLHKHVAKALRVATSIRLDAETRAIAILESARGMIA